MSKGRNKYKWADGGNAPRHGPVTPIERTLDVIAPYDYVQRQSCHWAYYSGFVSTEEVVNVGRVFDLMALGYTGQEIEELKELIGRSMSAGPDRIFYRRQARKRGKPVFGYNRLYKKSHEPGPKRLAGTVVWMRGRGLLWPFPEVGDEH